MAGPGSIAVYKKEERKSIISAEQMSRVKRISLLGKAF